VVVFSDSDIRGFKNVGEGSKRLDETSIGQFGRGSQTMFHWTDVPMIISGEKILFLE
jgi:sacsin